MSGNFVIGIIVFAILVIVNFVVITKGSGRIAEVAARFQLDSMPGKQMAIDADLSAGLIDEKTAKARRKALEDESGFFGAMDGASKFVRGDAIAGLLIVFINVIGGIIIGVAQQGMSFGDAARTYTVLTVGDGLVTQVPALIVSTAAGLLVSKAGITGSADKAMMKQLSGYPQALGMSAGVMLVLALLPGIPMLPVPRARRRRRGAGLEGAQPQRASPRRGSGRRRRARTGSRSRPGRRRRADRHRAQDRRPQDRTRLCAAAAGQRPRRHRPPDRADQGAAPFARDRNGLCDAGGAHPRQRPARGQHLRHQDQGSGRRLRQDLAEPVHGHGPRRQPGRRARHPYRRADVWPARDLGRRRAEGRGIAEGLYRGRRRHRAVDASDRAAQEQHERPAVLWRGAEALKDLPKEQGELVKDIVPSQVTVSGIQRVLQLLLAERISIRDLSTISKASPTRSPSRATPPPWSSTSAPGWRGRSARRTPPTTAICR
jgi:flagellar biosynthesis protein FlhA